MLPALVGAGLTVPCLDGTERPYRDLDSAASTPAMQVVADAVADFLPWYSSVHRGAGYKSRMATAAYEGARESTHRFAGRPSSEGHVWCALPQHYRSHQPPGLPAPARIDDVVVTTVVEHHANLLPWARVAQRRWVECRPDGTFGVDDVTAVLDAGRRPALLTLTGASNVTGWVPPVEEICAEAHARGILVMLDAAQLAPHRPLPPGPDFVAYSGHKLYAPYGAGALIGPRALFRTGDPFLAGGGAVDLVDLDEVIWTEPPEREEAGSPNVVGVVAFGAAQDELGRIGWPAIGRHEAALALRLHEGRAASTVCVCWVRAGPVATPWPWPRSRSRGCITGWWRPASARSSASGCGTDASAPIPTCSASSASVRRLWPRPGRRCCGGPPRHSRGGAGQLWSGHLGGGRGRPVGRPARAGPGPAAAPLRTGRGHRGFLPLGQARGWGGEDRPPGQPAPVATRLIRCRRPGPGTSGGALRALRGSGRPAGDPTDGEDDAAASGGMPVPQLNAASARSQFGAGAPSARARSRVWRKRSDRSSLSNGRASSHNAAKRGSPRS